MAERSGDVVVVGAGIVGLSSAYRLARDGWAVTIVDPAPGSGATFAAAGMLAPSAEITPGETANYQLQRAAMAGWHELARELLEDTSEVLDLGEAGTLLVGFDASDRRLVEQFALVAREFGAEVEAVTRRVRPDYFHEVSPRVSDGLFLPGDGTVDPDVAVALLRRALDERGATWLAECALSATTTATGVALTTESSTVTARVGLFATGASPLPDGVATGARHVVRPVRGTTVRLRGPDRSAAPTLRALVRGRSCYLVSRSGGADVLGATSEEQRELGVEVGELQRLLRDALDVVPSLETAIVSETRQGLRPASVSHEPFLEQIDEHWWWASGHYRHGVTLAPLVSREIAERVGLA